MTQIEMVGVREHGEEYPVSVARDNKTARWVILAANEGGYNSTVVDLFDLLKWINHNYDTLMREFTEEERNEWAKLGLSDYQ